MMRYLNSHLIADSFSIKEALEILEKQGLVSNVLFVIDENKRLRGSVTDGDIRRGLLKGYSIDDKVDTIMNANCSNINGSIKDNEELERYKKANILFIPVVDDDRKILDVINLKGYKNILPVDAVIMAGGRGQRLTPLTLTTPKPLLIVGNKPIIEHNIDRLKTFGIRNIHISINYMADQLIKYFGDGNSKGLSIKYINEAKPLGTIGSVKLAENDLTSDAVLIMNSDLLTNMDFNEFYNIFKNSNADMMVAATSYHVEIPYAVMEVNDENCIQSLKEKPKYTYYSNAGIYLVKKDLLSYIPLNIPFNSTDLIEALISIGKKIITYPILGYWLDIGRIEDYKKAQEDIKHINFG